MASKQDKAVLHAIFNPSMPIEAEQIAEPTDRQPADARSKALEAQAVHAAEGSSNYDAAIDLLSQAIAVDATNASAYNNRAQAYRLRGDVESALSDLDQAIDLSTQNTPKTLSSALVQRAMIKRLRGDDDGAMADFSSAAKLGCPFAKTQLVALNPYAAMCNKMLGEMMGKLQRGEAEDAGEATSAA